MERSFRDKLRIFRIDIKLFFKRVCDCELIKAIKRIYKILN